MATVEIAKTSLRVRMGSRTVAKGKPTATLSTGTYQVVQSATYRTFTIAARTGKKTYSAYKTKTANQTLVIRQSAKPTRVSGSGGYDCPGGYPVKGNASSMISHVPGGSYYSRTKPEECFSSESAARAAGYRASQR